jgi:hypothetical protein
MRKLAVAYLRFLAFSVAALALAACAKLGPAELGMRRPEPKQSEPPEAAKMVADLTFSHVHSDSIEELEQQVAALDAELANLRKALDVMGPLPEQVDLFIATAIEEKPEADPRMENAARLARLYSPVPRYDPARSLFHEAQLGAFRNHAAAEAGWKKLAASRQLAGFDPRFGANASQSLLAGLFASDPAVDALCVELSALAGACRVPAPVRAY